MRTWQGWAYLAVVLDVHTRRIVGWQLAPHMRQSLVIDAFEMALHARREHADGLVAHSDNGAQGEFKRSSQHLDIEEVAMGPRGLDAVVGAASCDRSPGRPPAGRREHRVRFWAAIARGLPTEEAAVEAGVSPAVGIRWFREGGGMPTVTLHPLSGRYLSFAEREEIAICACADAGVREIARQTGRSPSTISRELRRNAATRSGASSIAPRPPSGMPTGAPGDPRPPSSPRTWSCARYVQDRLAGGSSARTARVAGPRSAWRAEAGPPPGPALGDRAGARSRSPSRLRVDFPDDESMRISHEAIYQSLYVQGRGALRRELTACLRTGRALRVPQGADVDAGKELRDRGGDDQRAARRGRGPRGPGHWEGDLIIGANSSAIGTLVERSRASPCCCTSPDGGPRQPADEERPAARGAWRRGRARRDRRHDHDAARAAAPLADLGPGHRDGPARAASHRHRSRDLLLRSAQPLAARHQREHQRAAPPVLPEGHRPRSAQRDELAAVAATLNGRPRKTLGWKTPAEALDELLVSFTSRCCDDPLNPLSTPPMSTSSASSELAPCPAGGAPARRWTTPWPRAYLDAKRELISRYRWPTRLDLELALVGYIGWYNSRRRHRSLRHQGKERIDDWHRRRCSQRAEVSR